MARCRSTISRDTGREDPRHSPGPPCAHRHTRILLADVLNRQPGFAAPLAHLLGGLAVRVGGVVPIEVDVVVCLEAVLFVPEDLRHVPVEEALDVIGAGWN